jgi:AcrR family transcriptional regulator
MLTEKPLRADARRNRKKVLKAARAVFAEQGRGAQIDDVARRADVGVGTVYRHFPTKEALLDALVDEQFGEIAAHARTALERDDPWEALLDIAWFSGERNASDRAFSEIMAARQETPAPPSQAKIDLNSTIADLIRRCQAAGKMRPDVVVEDIALLMCGVGSASAIPHPVPEAWRRHMAILLDGLRAESASGPLHGSS